MEKKNTVLITVTLSLVAVLLVLIVVSMAIGGAAHSPTVATMDSVTKDDTIAVYGQGKISIKPDIAYITFGVETTDVDPQKAQDESSSSMDKVIAAIKDAGIGDADIQTMQYNVDQDYDYSDEERKLIGYRVTNIVQIKLHDIDRAGEIIKTAYDAGANRFDGIRFDVIERQEAYIKALDTAMARALEKAERIAEGTRRSIAGIALVQESGTNASPYYSTASNFAVADNASMADYGSGTISSGELEITATVNVVYTLK